jgi:hypothetical protein
VYLPGKKNVVADALSRLDIDSLKIPEEETEEVLTLQSGSEINSISNFKFSVHTALVFKVQAKDISYGIKRKGLSPTSLLNTAY